MSGPNSQYDPVEVTPLKAEEVEAMRDAALQAVASASDLEELRRVRMGPLYRPNATLRELYEAYLAQYDVAPSTIAFLKDNMKPALASFGDERIGELRVDRIAAWRKSLPEGKRYRGLRSLRQVLAAGVRWKWIEDNPAALVKNPEPKPGEIFRVDASGFPQPQNGDAHGHTFLLCS